MTAKQTAAKPTRGRTRRPAAPKAADQTIPADLIEAFGDRVRLVQDREPRAPEQAIARLLYAAQRLDLDPLTDLYLAEGRSRDGADAEWSVTARRDALLKVANRRPDYRGMDSDVIHEHDEFARVEPRADGFTLRQRAGVQHTYGMPAQRGAVVGAWAAVEVVNRDGTMRPATYFLATLAEYQPPIENLADGDPWKDKVAACITKAAQLWALRIALGLEDIVGIEETAQPQQAPAGDYAPPLLEDEPSDPIDDRILSLFQEAHELVPGRWPRAMVTARTAGQSDEVRQALADEMEASLLQPRAAAAVAG